MTRPAQPERYARVTEERNGALWRARLEESGIWRCGRCMRGRFNAVPHGPAVTCRVCHREQWVGVYREILG